MSDIEDRRGPGLKFPPPLLVIGIIGLGYLVDWIVPLPISTWDLLWLTGIALIVLSIILALIALFHFLEAKTHVEPWHPTTTIIDKGLFRYSRNPIYLAFCSTTVGSGLALNSWWIVMGVLPLVYLLQKLVIKREETYLETKFGKVYLDYKSRVRRWL
ncbi:MAG: isoprenylcysteine carboxylmethyltransferase family protein [Gammaproteobacteria bacterium]|nr:isoprenylcysteine carboxylmethyltransferase family protein [Gammaproteobacteria bacterium]MDH3859448.1 isoprenylcysteine carboxylmethyltransferase family protein [Gammaproteobacteria bacterium]